MDQSIRLIIGGMKIDAQIETKSETKSKHTGKEIELLNLYFDIDETNHEELLKHLSITDNLEITSVNDEGVVQKKWKPTLNSSHNHTVGDPTYYHHLEIEESENLQVTELVIDNVIIKPYFYSETLYNDFLIINAKIQQSTNLGVDLDDLYIKNLNGVFFPVLRCGINETPVEMRFGRLYWSENENEKKYHLTLVEKGYDEIIIYDAYDDEITNVTKTAYKNSEIINQLLKLLVEKEIISQEEIDTLQSDVKSNFDKRARDIFHIPDVDKIK